MQKLRSSRGKTGLLSRCDEHKKAARRSRGKRKGIRLHNSSIFEALLQCDNRRRHPEAERRVRQRAASRPGGGLLSGLLRAPGASRGQRLQAVRLERAARRRAPRKNPRARTARRISSVKPVRHVGSRRTCRVSTPPGDDGGGGGDGGSDAPASTSAQNARALRESFQPLNSTFLSQTLFSLPCLVGVLVPCTLLLRRGPQ